MPLAFPHSRIVDQVDDYHGTAVADPYRWLEDVGSSETQEWISAQNALTNAFFQKIRQRERIRARLTELWNYPRVSAPCQRGGSYFQFRNSGLQNQDVLNVMGGLHAEPRILLDPNKLSEDGTVGLVGIAPSPDGKYFSFSTTTSGSDWQTWRVIEVSSGRLLDDVVEWCKFTRATWLPDSSGFFYGRYNAPQGENILGSLNLNQKLFFHRIGTPQSEDKLVYQRPDEPKWRFDAEVSEDGSYLIVHIRETTAWRSRVYYKELRQSGEIVPLIDNFDAGYTFVANDGERLYFHTNRSPRGELIAVDLNEPEPGKWTTIIPESSDALEEIAMVNDQFIALYLHDAHHRIALFARDGAPHGELPLPGIGSLVGVTRLHSPLAFAGHRADSEMFYAFQSFIQPPTPFRYGFNTKTSVATSEPQSRFDSANYETRQVFATSKDGTRVPMFLTHRKGLRADGRNPTFLYGYGGFNISLVPDFQVMRLVWLEMGGVFAQANLRGGSEYGEDWHAAGTLERKQNVFDDFIACAEWLIDSKITFNDRLAIYGRSNGGLLIGAVLNQRPELFGAAIPAVGVMDMLRFHRFTIGWGWVADYGSPDDPTQFGAIRAYSPYHNIRPGTRYPPTLILTADHDDRVFPAHSFKYAAALQAAQSGDNPVLIRIESKAGHGFGRPTKFLIDEATDIWSFTVNALGM